jgi:hypothetical protein
VHLKLSTEHAALIVPVNTLLFRPEGVMVAVLQGDKAVLTQIKLGKDYGSEVEVVSGLNATDSIVLNPSDSLVSGAQVKIAQEPAKPEQPGAKPEAGKPEAPKPAPAASPAAPEKKS